MMQFYGPYQVPFDHITPDVEVWLRKHVGDLDWRVNVNEQEGCLDFYFCDAQVGTLFGLIWG